MVISITRYGIMPRKTPLLNEIYFALLEEDRQMTAKEIARFINNHCRRPYTVKAQSIIKCLKNCKQNTLVKMNVHLKPYIFTLKQ